MAPEQVQTFMAEVRRQITAARRESVSRQAHLKKSLSDATTAITHMVDMVESGTAPMSILERLREREQEKARIEAELAAQPVDDGVVAMMPDLAEVYARKVADLANALNDPEIKAEATEMIRQLIDKVMMIPDADAPDGMRMELHGALAEILALGSGGRPKSKLPGLCGPGSQLSVVAGA